MSQRDLLYIGIAIVVAGFLAESFAVDTTEGTWRLHTVGDRIDLDMRSGSPFWSWRTRLGLDPGALEGLDAEAIATRGSPVRFSLTRPAGRFDFEGKGGRRPAGDWAFVPDASFRDAVDAIALRPPDDGDLMRMAIDAMPREFLDGLAAIGYDRIDPDHLVRLMNRDISLDHIAAMQSLGERPGLAQIVRLHDHGIGPAFVEDLVGRGLEGIRPEDLIRIRSHGIDSDYLQEITALGFGADRINDLIRLRNHGITPAYVAAARRLHDDIGVGDILRLRDHGVDAEAIDEMRDRGLVDLSVDEIVRLRTHGVGADMVAALREGGCGHLGVEEIIRLRNHGVSADDAVRLHEAGWTELPAEDLIRLRTQGIAVERVEEFARLGYGPDSLQAIVRFQQNGVTPDLVARFREAGWDPPPEDLVRLRRHGVSPESARRAREAGFVEVEDLIRIDRIGLEEAVRRREADEPI